MKKKLILIFSLFTIALLSSSCFFAADRNNPHDPGALSEYYVSNARGDDTNNGAKNSPFKTIQKALTLAEPGNKIHVEEGDYTGAGILLQGVELLGGYAGGNNFYAPTRSVENTTTITYEDSESIFGESDRKSVIHIKGNSTHNTLVDGFNINGGTGPYMSAIHVELNNAEGFSAAISHNIINGGTGTENSSDEIIEVSGIAVINENSLSAVYSVNIDSNDIYGGQAVNENSPSGIEIYGILLQNDSLTDVLSGSIINNTIESGYLSEGSNPIAGQKALHGIYCLNTSPNIYHNTIDVGDHNNTTADPSRRGINIKENSSPAIVNNIFFENTADNNEAIGIYESSEDAEPSSVFNNNFYNLEYTYFSYGTGPFITVELLNNQSTTYSANISADPSFVSDSDWHLTIDSHSSVKEGGTYLTDVPTDKDGTARSDPPSIGAYEYGAK